MSKLVLYHGSDKIVKSPQYGAGKLYNDYGQGFYCTEQIELAKEWAIDDKRDGFVNTYYIDDKGLKILNLNDKEYSILHWLDILLEHRTFNVNNPLAKEGLDYLHKNYHIDTDGYDAIIGYRADDSYFSFARAFLTNTISIEQLENAIYIGNLGQQFFIKSKKAFSRLKFVEAIPVDYTDYYPMKDARDKKAREDYVAISGTTDKEGVYLLDLIRKEVNNGPSI